MRQSIVVSITAAAVAWASAASAAAAPIHVAVDMRGAGPAAPRSIDVTGTPRVVLDISRTLIQACTVEQKASAQPAEANPLGAILAVASGAFGARTAVAAPPGDLARLREALRASQPAWPCGLHPIPPPEGDEAAAAIESALARVDVLARDARVDLMVYGMPAWSAGDPADAVPLAQAAAEIRALTRCRQLAAGGGRTEDACGSFERFRAAAASVGGDLRAHLDLNPPPALDAIASELGGVRKALDKYDAEDEEATRWLLNAEQRAACAGARLEALTATRAGYQTARNDIRAFDAALQAFLAAGNAGTLSQVDIRPVPASVVTATVRCVNVFTGQSTAPSASEDAEVPVADVAVQVAYRANPRATVSAGVLLSGQARRQFTTEARPSGVDRGVATTVTAIVRTNDAPVQAVPFSFLNLRLWSGAVGLTDVGIAASAGVGLNRNSGASQVEYFAGAGVSVRKVVVLAGAHVGRVPSVGGGFAVGQLVPASTDVPVRYAYQPAWAVAVSYRIPLP